ncbi:MAG: CaiB/BaiF CoA transferase family protein [Cyclobacteriaceae bacterium]
MKPLHGITVVDFSQFLSGPSASLRLADLGARVIKVEHPEHGDIGRNLYMSSVRINEESSFFYAINRNKESFAANLKDENDLAKVLKLIDQVDVVMHNFRPGVAKRLGISYETIKQRKPSIIYGRISGYGIEGPWAGKPGQDLLVQSISGLTWLSGNEGNGPVPMGLAIADIFTGAHLAQGILAALVRRGINGEGALIEVNMMESIIDLQFEAITTYLQDGGKPVTRTAQNNAHAYLGAPYGIYQTSNGYLALAMGQIPVLGELLDCPDLLKYREKGSWFTQRDEIKAILAKHLTRQATESWLEILEPADIWCADVLDWDRLLAHEGFKVLNMIQSVTMSNDLSYQTTRCPITLNDEQLISRRGAPILGEHNAALDEEFGL